MNGGLLILFVILLLALILCSFLGGKCEGMENGTTTTSVTYKSTNLENTAILKTTKTSTG